MPVQFTRERLFFLAAAALCVYTLSPFLLPLALGAAVAYLFEPFYESLLKIWYRLRKRPARRMAAFMVAGGIILGITAIVIVPLLFAVIKGVLELSTILTNLSRDGSTPLFAMAPSLSDVAKNFTVYVNQQFGLLISPDTVLKKMLGFLDNVMNQIISYAQTTLTATPKFLVDIGLFFLAWFFFLLHGKFYRKVLLEHLIPWKEEREMLASTSHSVLHALVIANLGVAFFQALTVGISLAMFSVPHAVFLGFLAFFASFIPGIGTALVMLGAAAWCYFANDWTISAVALVIISVGVGLLDNVLRPYLMGGSTNLSFFWTLLAVMGGLATMGLPGALLGPIFFALFVATLQTLRSLENSKNLSHSTLSD